MAAQDLHEVIFEWPHTEPTSVIVTGTFDEWSCSVHLTKTPTGFVGSTKIPWGEKIKFKFVVDDKWLLHENQITEMDPGGFVNHVYTAPAAPPANEAPSVPESVADSTVKDEVPVADTLAENGHNITEDAVEQVADVEPAVDKSADSDQVPDVSPAGFPQLLSNIAHTIAARDGTSSALGYVTSGLGAAIHNVVGVDPINTQQIGIPTPVADAAFVLPGGQESESSPNSAAFPTEPNPDSAVKSAPELLPSPIAPFVPLMIVPVNAAENNTVAALPPPENESEVADAPFIPKPAPAIADVVEEPILVKTEESAPTVETAIVVAEEATLAAADSDPIAAVIAEPAIVEKPVPVGHVYSAEPIIAEATPVISAQEPVVEAIGKETLTSEPESAVEVEKPAGETKIDEVATAGPIPVVEDAVVSLVEEPQNAPTPIDSGAGDVSKAVILPVVADTPSAAEDLPEASTVSNPEGYGANEPVSVVEDSPAPEETVVPTAIEETDTGVTSEPPAQNTTSTGAETSIPETQPLVSAPIEATMVDSIEEPRAVVETAAPEAPVANEGPTGEETDAEASIVPATSAAEPAGTENAIIALVSEEPVVENLPVSETEVASEAAVADSAVVPDEVAEVSDEVVAPTSDSAIAINAPEPPVSIKNVATEAPVPASEPAEVATDAPSAQPTPTVEETAGISESNVESPTHSEAVEGGEPSGEKPAQSELANKPTLAPVNGLDTVSKTDAPATNGHSSTAASPTTPTKAFPSTSESPLISADNSPSSSKVNTMRKKRTSILGKLKHIFHTDKDKERK